MLEDQTTNTGNTSIRCLNLEVDGTADCPLYHGDTILGFVDWLIWISGLSHKTGLGHSDSPVVRTLRYKPPGYVFEPDSYLVTAPKLNKQTTHKTSFLYIISILLLLLTISVPEDM